MAQVIGNCSGPICAQCPKQHGKYVEFGSQPDTQACAHCFGVVHCPLAASQVCPLAQLPQVPPHPSGPHDLPEHCGVQSGAHFTSTPPQLLKLASHCLPWQFCQTPLAARQSQFFPLQTDPEGQRLPSLHLTLGAPHQACTHFPACLAQFPELVQPSPAQLNSTSPSMHTQPSGPQLELTGQVVPSLQVMEPAPHQSSAQEPAAPQLWPLGQVPQLPPQPSAPQVLPAQVGLQTGAPLPQPAAKAIARTSAADIERTGVSIRESITLITSRQTRVGIAREIAPAGQFSSCIAPPHSPAFAADGLTDTDGEPSASATRCRSRTNLARHRDAAMIGEMSCHFPGAMPQPGGKVFDPSNRARAAEVAGRSAAGCAGLSGRCVAPPGCRAGVWRARRTATRPAQHTRRVVAGSGRRNLARGRRPRALT